MFTCKINNPKTKILILEKKTNMEKELINLLSELGINKNNSEKFLEEQRNKKKVINMMKELGINDNDIMEFIKTEKNKNHKEFKKQEGIKEEDKLLYEDYKQMIIKQTPKPHNFVTTIERELFDNDHMASSNINIVPSFKEWKINRTNKNNRVYKDDVIRD
jgi:hypothetical protein